MSTDSSIQNLRPQFRLRRGRDDVLITWMASFEPRQRSRAIRKALRAYLLGQTGPKNDQAHCEDQGLAAALDALF
jgi:hypothetical protein